MGMREKGGQVIFYESFTDRAKRIIVIDYWFRDGVMLNPKYHEPAKYRMRWLYIFRELLRRYEEVTLAYARYIFGYWSGWFFDRRMRKFKYEKIV